MKIKLFLVSTDTVYAERLSARIRECWQDKIEVSLFTRPEKVQQAAAQFRPDIVLMDKETADAVGQLPEASEKVLMTETSEICSMDGMRAIGKYQRVSEICGSLLEIYADRAEKDSVSFLNAHESTKRIITFLSPAGGTGSSTLAAAWARALAQDGEKTLYLDLELFHTVDQFFHAEGAYDFSRVLYALAMDNAATAARLENAMRRDPSGVYFYEACERPMDMFELNESYMKAMFAALNQSSQIDWIITDMDCTLDRRVLEQIARSYRTIIVSDGTEVANSKTVQFLRGLEVLAGSDDKLDLGRVNLMYNRFGSQTGQQIEGDAFRELGGINRFENAYPDEAVQLISEHKILKSVIDNMRRGLV